MKRAAILPVLWFLGRASAFAGAPPEPPAVPPAPPPTAATPPKAPLHCPAGQRCGDACIEWTAVCTSGLADAIGLPPASTSTPVVPPAGAPPGSTLVSLPRLVDATAPTMRADAPPWCTSGLSNERLAAECIGYYQLGSTGGSITPTTAPADCPQHLRCAGVCLGADEVCPATERNASSRLRPYDDPEPPPLFR